MAGIAMICLWQVAAPFRSPPLYDGVVVQDPYRYLAPGPNQPGSPGSGASTTAIQGDTSPRFAVATSESPPQAQLIAPPGAFVVPAGATSLSATIQPIAAGGTPSSATIAGNVYRFVVVDQSGSALAINPATPVTLVLRAPQGITDSTIERLVGGTWQPSQTLPAGQPGIFVSNVAAIGDYALIAAAPSSVFGLDPTLLAVGSIGVIAGLIVIAAILLRGRAARPAIAPPLPRKGKPTRQRSRRRHDG
jgi:hypothetical protein